MLSITLRQEDGSGKTYTQEFISGRMFRRTIEMQKLLKSGVDVGTLDQLANYVCEVFGKQFTLDQLYDGVAAGRLIPTISDCINAVVSGASESIGASEADPN